MVSRNRLRVRPVSVPGYYRFSVEDEGYVKVTVDFVHDLGVDGGDGVYIALAKSRLPNEPREEDDFLCVCKSASDTRFRLGITRWANQDFGKLRHPAEWEAKCKVRFGPSENSSIEHLVYDVWLGGKFFLTLSKWKYLICALDSGTGNYITSIGSVRIDSESIRWFAMQPTDPRAKPPAYNADEIPVAYDVREVALDDAIWAVFEYITSSYREPSN